MTLFLEVFATYFLTLLLLVNHIPFFADLMDKKEETEPEPTAYVQTVPGDDIV